MILMYQVTIAMLTFYGGYRDLKDTMIENRTAIEKSIEEERSNRKLYQQKTDFELKYMQQQIDKLEK